MIDLMGNFMGTWGVLAAGLLVVVVGILRFKLHAFVALILAATVVALLTPATVVSRSSAREAIDRSAVLIQMPKHSR